MRHLWRGAPPVLSRENREDDVACALARTHESSPGDLENLSGGGETETARTVEHWATSYPSAVVNSHLERPSYRGVAEAVHTKTKTKAVSITGAGVVGWSGVVGCSRWRDRVDLSAAQV